MQAAEIMDNIVQEGKIELEVATCQRCGVTEACAMLDKGRNFNDFGLRYCRYCGLMTDESGSVVQLN